MLDFFRIFRSKKATSSSGAAAAAQPQAASRPEPPAAAPVSLSDTPRIFLSYSRADAAFAAEVRRMIEGRDLSLWQDISHMEAGRWWDQIENILSAPTTEHMVLVVSSDALASKVVRDEWRLARREGVQVSPVRAPGRLGPADFDRMPGWMKAEHFFDVAKPEQVTRLIRGIEGPSRQVRVPLMAPHPAAHFVLRPAEGDQLTALMLKGENAAVGITAALRGAGGYGKTQLARWLAHRVEIEDAFYDGILWVELGEHPRVHDLIEGLIGELTGAKPGLPNATMAAARLKERIADRRMLLVIDDVWNKSDLDPFLGGAPNLVRLITTRFDHVLPHDAAKVPVEAMKPAEAAALLVVGLPSAQIEASRPALLALARRLGEWPLLLTLANAILYAEVEGGATVTRAITFVVSLYNRIGLAAFDSGDEASRNSAARLSIGASLGRLNAARGEVARFEELAVFPEDEDIPAATVNRLWQATAGLDPLAGELLLSGLRKWALLLAYDRGAGTVRLHDVMRKFLRDRVGADGLVAQAQALIAAYAGSTGSDLDGPERHYYYRYLPQHLQEAGEHAKLDALLMSPAWMQEKLSATGARTLIDDYRYARTQAQRVTGQTLALMAGVLARDPRQLMPQILGRLIVDLADEPAERAVIEGLLLAGRELIILPALAPRWASFAASGGPEVRRFEAGGVANAIAFSPDGCHVVSGSADGTLRLWEVASGASRRLDGHRGEVRAVAFSPDGRHVVSGADDHTLRLWEVASGVWRALEGHDGGVNAAAFSPDGRHVVSGSADGTLRLWEVANGASRGLRGHGGQVKTVAFSPDGRHVVSGSYDYTLRLWEVASAAQRVLEGHRGGVYSVAFTPDGRYVVSGSSDGTLRRWDAATGVSRTLEGHGGAVWTVAVSPDGQHVVSGSSDGTLRHWDLASGASHAVEGRFGTVYAVAFSPDGRHVVSSSQDGTLRQWDLASRNSRALGGHGGAVYAVAFSPNGRHVISASFDHTLRQWDATSGDSHALATHGDGAWTVALSPGGPHVISGSHERTLRLRALAGGQEIARFEGDSDFLAIDLAPDGRSLAAGDSGGRVHLLDILVDAADKATWLARQRV